MIALRIFFNALVFCFCLSGSALSGANDAYDPLVPQIAENSMPAVCHFVRVGESSGTGFVIDGEAGLIVSNRHIFVEEGKSVIQGNRAVEVVCGEKRMKARLVSLDRKYDLALLKAETVQALPALPLTDRYDLEKDGVVIIIGFPRSLNVSVTTGLLGLSGSEKYASVIKGRRDPNIIAYRSDINPGNSGSPVIDLKGEAIGIAFAVNSENRKIGYGVHAREIRRFIDDFHREERHKADKIKSAAEPNDYLVLPKRKEISAQDVADSIVSVESTGGRGCGVIVRHLNIVLTSASLLGRARNADIRMADGTLLKAGFLYSDPVKDIAAFKLMERRDAGLLLGDSNYLKTGEQVFAVELLENDPVDISIKKGVISSVALDTRRMELARGESLPLPPAMYQINIKTEKNSFGSPVVNARKQIVGIVINKLQNYTNCEDCQGIGFILPVSEIVIPVTH